VRIGGKECGERVDRAVRAAGEEVEICRGEGQVREERDIGRG